MMGALLWWQPGACPQHELVCELAGVLEVSGEA